MPSNIELKAWARDFERQMAVTERLSGESPQLLQQTDVFFAVSRGRLKLRILASDKGELIVYSRPNLAEIKRSDFEMFRTDHPEVLRSVLESGLEVLGIVRKRRQLFLVRQTRIHFDEVEGLGKFVELEVVLNPDQSVEEGHEIATGLMGELGIQKDDLIGVAYIDLLAAKNR